MANKQTPVAILAFHKDVFAIAQTGHRAGETMHKKMCALLTSRYGKAAPTYEQYRADRAALLQLAKDRKLASDQWVRKPFCAAVKAMYGALPEAQTPEAIAKRALRAQQDAAVKAAKAAAAAPVGAPKGETQDRQPTEAEQVESLVTRIGLFKTLEACVRILEADEATKAQALHIRKMVAKAAGAMKAETPAT